MTTDPAREALIAEAKALAVLHSSKDARAFAENVFDYLTALVVQLDDYAGKDRRMTAEYNLLVKENRELSAALAAQPAEPVQWVDRFGSTHTMTLNKATETLRQIYDEWPGGLEEIESSGKQFQRRTAAAPAEPATQGDEPVAFLETGIVSWSPALRLNPRIQWQTPASAVWSIPVYTRPQPAPAAVPMTIAEIHTTYRDWDEGDTSFVDLVRRVEAHHKIGVQP